MLVQAVKRILVTGNAGAGKTTFARRLAAHTGLPYVGLDSVVWRPRWQKAPPDERRVAERAIACGERWIVDGVSDELLAAADAVVFLDVPRSRCLWRVFWRSLPYLFRSRPGLPDRCPELLILPTVARIIRAYPSSQPKKLFAEAARRSVCVHHVRDKASYSAAFGYLIRALETEHETIR